MQYADPAVAQAAAARKTVAATNTGHPAGITATSRSASGNGLVKTWPIYPQGRERRVLRFQRRRCRRLAAKGWLPI